MMDLVMHAAIIAGQCLGLMVEKVQGTRLGTHQLSTGWKGQIGRSPGSDTNIYQPISGGLDIRLVVLYSETGLM